MEVLLLGTGSADGWPNPFCTCPSCAAARTDGPIRGQTAALVDGVLLLDCGPEAPRAAARAGRVLDGVRHILLTHAHPDHLGPAAALWRDWAHLTAPLAVWGPPAAVAAWAPWVRPGADVTLTPVAPGDRLRLVVGAQAYDARVLVGTHEPVARGGDPVAAEAVIYDVTGPAGGRLLWATDTGPLAAPTLAAVTGASYDLVLLDETFGEVTDHGTGHLDLRTFPAVLADLRRVGAVTGMTDVVAVHLGHGNPPPRQLDRRLAGWHARTVADLAVLTAGPGPGGAPAGHPAPAPRAHRTLLLGGARSGKSGLAESLLAAEPDVRYVATAVAPPAGSGATEPVDPEWAARIAAHRARRPAGWRTEETPDVPAALLAAPAGSAVLVDSLTLWLTGVLDRAGGWPDPGAATQAARQATAVLVDAVTRTRARVVLVSDEVGLGVVPATASGRLFRDLLGQLNAAVAARCDEVTLVVAGRPVHLGGGSTPGTGREGS